MARVEPTVTRKDDDGWSWTWPAGTPPYQVWLDGELLGSPTAETFDLSIPGYEDVPPEIEVRNAADVSENSKFPDYALIQWRGIPSAVAYQVEQFIGASWVVVANLMEEAQGYYSWQSPPLDDVTTYQWRVYATDLVGNRGNPIASSIDVCRNPLAPRIEVSFSSSGNLVVSSA